MAKKLPRRKFLQGLGGAAAISALPSVAKPQTKRSVAIFFEHGFPRIQTGELNLDFPGTFLTEQELIARLNTRDFDLFINPYGSAFPKRAWRTILEYLRAGGNWLNLGGVPLSRPVVRTASGWRAEPYQASYHKRLGITHFFPVQVGKIARYESELRELADSFRAAEVYELYIRLSSTNNEPDEAGSDGPHEGGVESLVFGLNRDGRRIAAPIVQVDRWQAEFAGGRWVFANFDGPLTANAVRVLAERAARGAVKFRVRSEFACYGPGEVPSLSIELIGRKTPVNTEVRSPSGQLVKGSISEAGLYTIKARIDDHGSELTHESGFWVYDAELLKRRKPLTVDKHFFYRDAKVFPVTGTTYMASDVHRRFLFEPNPRVWDRDFAAMKTAGVNMVRTGIWTGWKKYMPELGKVNEGVLRAFDAFLLTAHKHDIPVIFTFFAFLPETWGGANAYLDPRAVKAQQQFVSAFAERCRDVDDVLWDFINEPSFCSPKYLWNCRPNYDEFEKAAWKQWLRERYPATSDEELMGQLQQRWRTTRDDVLELPKLQDFESVHLIDDRQPLKTLDYRLFAQDMFIRWLRQMTTAVRSNGNAKQLITVGQDEAGLGDSPNMQFFAPYTDFTSIHNWWNNDDIVWDSVLAKTPSKASLVEETGVMFYERADGDEPWRSEQEVANLLERKMAISLAADGAGFVEWIWNTNPYMNSTNEVGIGFHRVDGTAKPELEPFLAIAKFMGQHGSLLRDREPEQVVMVAPHSQMFSPRGFAQEATRRCVRAMYYHCGVAMQAVSEYALADYAGETKLIIVPAPGVLTQQCWDALMRRAQAGATVAITGVTNGDEHSLPVQQTESFAVGKKEYLVRFEGEKIQRVERAAIFTDTRPGPAASSKPGSTVRGLTRNEGDSALVEHVGRGRLIRCALPLELGDAMEALAAFYRFAMDQARVAPRFMTTPRTPAVLVLPSVFCEVVLYTFVSEIDRDTTMQVTDLETKARFVVNVPAGRTSLTIIDRRSGKRII
ncbi:MAG TPA: cellulase family glycosylhydrolase [Pyrinomonadaceae bacterium]|nr:cellulase family glycosylhydrolase [Pyrinomonadaceae bacterium]